MVYPVIKLWTAQDIVWTYYPEQITVCCAGSTEEPGNERLTSALSTCDKYKAEALVNYGLLSI